jgi:uncharacterized integral membrane protein
VKRLRQILFALVVLSASLLAIANRTAVTFSFDPIPPASDALSFRAPLFLVIFISILFGIMLGGIVVKLGQRKPVAPAAAIEGNTGGHARL